MEDTNNNDAIEDNSTPKNDVFQEVNFKWTRLDCLYVTAILSWDWVEVDIEVEVEMRLRWDWVEV